ncbi:deoxyribodipyrimidine photolyase [Formosa agariphila KMM 3901]|uniref:Deoxyribodipyrimidine photolyase n=1 Tax=Formosa agariphila (strain DSM 15362 / KCTC 12365 / LMG 23005 / KMM 3901 / M-2Alg 35-1) TaxID=1347342 RepID=T2KI67_FORAG|nr:deoxyribodipyrimidine photo-lyase [Formosa agariphila]CDF78121.1 deoxyribodipyrimidine photolyase [Formosa agariphila KMM 3901]
MTHTIFWFRRDLRFTDNTALFEALKSNTNVLPIFIFDDNILNELEPDDARVQFIYKSLERINSELKKHKSSVLCLKGNPLKIWKQLLKDYIIEAVFTNTDYEPYARTRDAEVEGLLHANNITFHKFKDQVIFEPHEILKQDGNPYTVYTPYKNKWLEHFKGVSLKTDLNFKNLHQYEFDFPSLEAIGFKPSSKTVKEFQLEHVGEYAKFRDFPNKDIGSYLGPHLRFGTVSIREIISELKPEHSTFLSELIWREFFMQILFHFPHVVHNNFRSKYDDISWRNNEAEFKLWCEGKTGYPMVDAGMRQLNKTGYMHNRVRMVTAAFLCKHLLIHWTWGEAYFAKHLLDYELASNNGNWQWSAGTGCDAAPYFRIFNPITQLEKFDKNLEYVKTWIPEYGTDTYPEPIVVHKEARLRALDIYKEGIKN